MLNLKNSWIIVIVTLFINSNLVMAQDTTYAMLNLPVDTECAASLISFQVSSGLEAVQVLPYNGKAGKENWHQWMKCLKDLQTMIKSEDATDAQYNFVYHQILYVLANSNVRFYNYSDRANKKPLKKVVSDGLEFDLSKFDRVVYQNDLNQAYNSMSQVGFGLWLLGVHKIFLEKGYGDISTVGSIRHLGLGVLSVIIDKVQNGGLRTRKTCEKDTSLKCSWFHSITSRNKSTNKGNTLNQALTPLRDLDRAADVLLEINRMQPSSDNIILASQFKESVLEGLHHLVFSSGVKKTHSPPNLMDYFVRYSNRNAVKKSWMYYSHDLNKDTGNFLYTGTPHKNCTYHTRNIKLLARILDANSQQHFILHEFTKPRPRLSDKSILNFMVNAFSLKEADGLLTTGARKSGGDYGPCKSQDPEEVLPQEFLEIVSELHSM